MSEKENVLKEIFERGFNLRSDDWGELSEKVKMVSQQKNELIRFSGQVEKHLYYLIEGATGTMMDKKGKQVCLDICTTGEFFGDYLSLLTQTKSRVEILALLPCTYLIIPFSALLTQYQQYPAEVQERIGRETAENLYVLKQQELIDIKTLDANERYLKMLEKEPQLVQDIPLKHLAAYLGITPESMSRIRKSSIQEQNLP